MKTRLLACLCLLAAAASARAQSPGLAGRWKLDASVGSPIHPWGGETLQIAVSGDKVEVDRHFSWGKDRQISDHTVLKADGATVTANPVAYWIDTWFNNADIGGDHHKQVSGAWIEPGRILKVESTLALDMQQGDFPIHIYDEYRLSADGRTLRLFELRSSRDQALEYVFRRE